MTEGDLVPKMNRTEAAGKSIDVSQVGFNIKVTVLDKNMQVIARGRVTDSLRDSFIVKGEGEGGVSGQIDRSRKDVTCIQE